MKRLTIRSHRKVITSDPYVTVVVPQATLARTRVLKNYAGELGNCKSEKNRREEALSESKKMEMEIESKKDELWKKVEEAKKTLAVLNEKILEPTNGIGAAETVQIRSTREKEKQEVVKLVSCGTEDQVVTKHVKLEIFNKLRSLHGMQGQED